MKDIPYYTGKFDFIFALCSFLDEFNRSDNKQELIAAEPDRGGLSNKDLCVLAAVAHKLSNDTGIDTPKWVYDKKYILPLPNYAFDTENIEYQEFLINTSPIEFKQRNIFVDENAIKRV